MGKPWRLAGVRGGPKKRPFPTARVARYPDERSIAASTSSATETAASPSRPETAGLLRSRTQRRKSRITATPTIDNGTIYVPTASGKLYAIEE